VWTIGTEISSLLMFRVTTQYQINTVFLGTNFVGLLFRTRSRELTATTISDPPSVAQPLSFGSVPKHFQKH